MSFSFGSLNNKPNFNRPPKQNGNPFLAGQGQGQETPAITPSQGSWSTVATQSIVPVNPGLNGILTSLSPNFVPGNTVSANPLFNQPSDSFSFTTQDIFGNIEGSLFSLKGVDLTKMPTWQQTPTEQTPFTSLLNPTPPLTDKPEIQTESINDEANSLLKDLLIKKLLERLKDDEPKAPTAKLVARQQEPLTPMMKGRLANAPLSKTLEGETTAPQVATSISPGMPSGLGGGLNVSAGTQAEKGRVTEGVTLPKKTLGELVNSFNEPVNPLK
jgi:hypothetical protein